MDDKKKKYIVPEATIIDFANDDIITASIAKANDPLNWGEEVDFDTF